MITRLLTTLIFVLLISSCGGPPPFAYEQWSQEGKTLLDLQRTLLECGLPNVAGKGQTVMKMTDNEFAIYELCMIGAGYIYKSKRGKIKTICELSPELNLPACRSGAPVSQRDPNRRINSDFCKSRQTSARCLP